MRRLQRGSDDREQIICASDEYFDEVVGHCSLCADVCLPRRGTSDFCALRCPGYYRQMERQRYQSRRMTISSSSSSSSSFLPLALKTEMNSSSSGESMTVTVAAVSGCLILLVLMVVICIVITRKQKKCFKSTMTTSSDECLPCLLLPMRNNMSPGSTNAKEKESLHAMETERGVAVGMSRPRSPVISTTVADGEALSSLCVETSSLDHNELPQKPPNILMV